MSSIVCRTAVVVLLAAPLFVGCSGDSSTPSTTSRGSTNPATSSSTPADSPYKVGFRGVYVPVLHTLGPLGGACDPVSKAKLPVCRQRLDAFQTSVTHLQHYVRDTPPPASAKGAADEVGTTAATMQRTWSKLAHYVAQGDVAAVNAMAGSGKPLTNNLIAWITAVEELDIKLGGPPLPIPSE